MKVVGSGPVAVMFRVSKTGGGGRMNTLAEGSELPEVSNKEC